jgi:archaellum component FlaC
MDMLKIMRKEMTADRNSNHSNFENLNKNINMVRNLLQALNASLTNIEKEQGVLKTEITTLKEENENLSQRVNELEGRMNDIEQYSRICNLEIRGVPVTTGENVFAILEKIAEVLKIDFLRDCISTCHRLPAPTTRDSRLHPAIVVQFTSRTTKARWLTAAKSTKMTAKDLSPNFNDGPVFINEHLTVHNKAVLARARRLVKSGTLAFAWCKDGKLFVRKTATSPVVRVWRVADVEAAAGTARTMDTNTGGGGGSAAATT